LFRVHTPPHDVNPRGPNSTAPVSQLTARGSSAPTRYGCPPHPGCRSALLRLRTILVSCQSPSLAIARPSAGKFPAEGRDDRRLIRIGATNADTRTARPRLPDGGKTPPRLACTAPRIDACAAMFGRKLKVSTGVFPAAGLGPGVGALADGWHEQRPVPTTSDEPWCPAAYARRRRQQGPGVSPQLGHRPTIRGCRATYPISTRPSSCCSRPKIPVPKASPTSLP
jgi:hypothetical protein